MKKDQNLPNKNIHSNNSSGKPLYYYTRPTRNDISIEQNVNEINTVVNNEKQRSSTKHIYQNIQKEWPREKIWIILFLLESPKSIKFQPPDLEIDF